MTKFKWTDEVTAQLEEAVAGLDVISSATVEEVAAQLGTTSRSVAAKLRKQGYNVATKSSEVTKASAWTEELVANLTNFVTDNSGRYTYAELAELFQDGAFSAKSLQGKLLSLELFHHVRKSEKKVTPRAFSPEQEAAIVGQVADGAFIEDIADSLGRTVASIRGKLLSLYREGRITKMPTQRNHVAAAEKTDVFAGLEIANLTVEEIATAIGKTARGVKSMLSRRGLSASDYTAKKTSDAE